MAVPTVRLRRSATQGAVPTTSQLLLGEVAINTYDGKLFIKKDVSGTESVVEIGASVAADTTPTLGGTLETNGNLIQFGDSSGATDDRLRFGAGNDLQIWHNGANSYISQSSDVGDLYITSLNDDNDVIIQTDSGDGNTTDYFRADGSTGESILYHYGSEKIKTVSGGVTITGTATATEFSGGGSNLTGVAKLSGQQLYSSGDLRFADDGGIYFGTGYDMYILHTSNTNIIRGNNQNLTIDTVTSGDILIKPIGSVELYENGNKRLETSSTGINVIGELTIPDSNALKLGDGTDFLIGHYPGTNASNAITTMVDLSITDGNANKRLDLNSGGSWEFYDQNESIRLTITTAGATVTGTLVAGGLTYPSSDGTNGQVLTTNGQGTLSWTTVSSGGGGTMSDLVDDTTPQLGGNLDVNGKNINFGDSAASSDDRLNFGAGTDLSIYFDGTNSYIDVIPDATNHLYIRNNVGNDVDFNGDIYIQAKMGENSIACYDDGSVYLYFDNALKFYTTSSGVTVSGTGLGNWKAGDSQYLTAGAGDDLQITHDGTNSFLNNRTGSLYIRSNTDGDVGGDLYIQAKSGENSISCFDDGSVYLYFDNALKFYTTSTGAAVSGTGVGNWKADDNQYLTAGTGDDFQITHDGTNTFLDNDTGSLYIRNNVAADVGGDIYIQAKSGENSISCFDDGSVYLYHDNVLQLYTTSTGVTISNTLSVGVLAFGDNQSITFGASSDLSIYHDYDSVNDISTSYIDNDTGSLYIRNNVAGDVGADIYIQAKSGENSISCFDDGSVYLYHDNVLRFYTTSAGVSVSGTGLGNWKAGDNQYLTAGTGDDFQIYHDGSNSYLDNDTGSLYIRNASTNDNSNIYIQAVDGENSIICNDDSSVNLYFDNVIRFYTTSSGVAVSGTGEGNWKAGDNQYLTAGTGDDFQIYHDGTNTFLDNDTGNLFIRNNVASDVGGDIYIRPHDNEEGIIVYDDGGVFLYHDNALKFYTTSTGVMISGDAEVTGTLSVGSFSFDDNDELTFGASNDLSIYHKVVDNVSGSYIDNDTGHLYIRNNVASDQGGDIYIRPHDNEEGIIVYDDGGVYSYYDNALKFYTTSTGVSVSGTGLGNWKAGDNQYLTAGAGDDFQIYHDGSNTFLDNDTGNIFIRNASTNDNANIYIQAVDGEHSIICNDDSSVNLYFDNVIRFYTTSTGVAVSGTGEGNWKAGDNQYLTAGTGDDLQIYHDATNTFLDNDTGNLYIRNNALTDVGGDIYIQAKSGEHSIICYDDSGVYLYHDNALKMYTTADGVTVSGTLSVTTLAFADNQTMTFGASSDLSIYHNYDSVHDISTSYIDNDTGHLYIRNNVDDDDGSDIYIQAKSGEHSIICYDDSGVYLYYDNALKFYTTSSGFTVSGTGLGNFKAGDSQYLTAGAGDDLQITHDGTNSFLNNRTGSLYIRSNTDGDVGGDIYIQAKTGEHSIICYDDGGVYLYDDNSLKFYTTSTGFTVSGTGLGNFKAGDSQYLTAGTGDDLQIYHDATNTFLDNDTGNLYIRNNVAADVGGNIYIRPHDNEEGIIITHDGGVSLYYDNVQKFYTTSTGATISGALVAGGLTYPSSDGTNGQVLTTNGQGTLSWTTVSGGGGLSNVVEDTTPQLGGNLDVNGKNIEFGDSTNNTDDTLKFGASGDLQIYHRGGNSYISAGEGAGSVGDLYIDNQVNDQDVVIRTDAGSGTIIEYFRADGSTGEAILYHYGTEKLKTSSTGVVIDSGHLSLNSGDLTLSSGDLNISNGSIDCSYGVTAGNFYTDDIDGNTTPYSIGPATTGFLIQNASSSRPNIVLSPNTNGKVLLGEVDVSGSLEVDNSVVVKSDDGTPGRVDLYCESSNAHYARLIAPTHSNFSGNVTITLPNSTGTLLNSDGSGSSLTGLTGASSGTYGDASNVAQIVVDANGRITGISEVAISGGGGGSSTLSGLSDVSISSPSTGQVLKYSGSAWVNGTDEGGSGSGISTGKAIAMAMVFG